MKLEKRLIPEFLSCKDYQQDNAKKKIITKENLWLKKLLVFASIDINLSQ